MAGTKAGALKARDKNLDKDPNFYANIGSRSWQNPNRSRKTGFANLPTEKVRELGAKGGRKTKKDYQTKEEYTTPEDIRQLTVGADLSE